MNPNQVIILLVGAVLLLGAAQLPASFLTPLEAAIKSASGVLGYVTALVGAVKAVIGVTGIRDVSTAEVQTAGISAAAGAILVLASAIA